MSAIREAFTMDFEFVLASSLSIVQKLVVTAIQVLPIINIQLIHRAGPVLGVCPLLG